MTLTHIDLFSGIGGFALAFQRAGMQTVAHVEIDPTCQRVLRHRFPGHLILSDVCEAGAHNLPPADVITFGSPCQDLSVAGKRAGLAGAKSGLFHESIRICRELRPTIAVWENVPGAFSSHRGRDFAAVLAAFCELGARDIAWRVLDAQHFGVPQRRRRIFLVADFGGERAGEILFESGRVSGLDLPRRETGKDVTPTLESRAGRSGSGDSQTSGGVVPIAFHASQDPISGSVSPALSANATIGVMQPIGVRRFTPRECERLQGFPEIQKSCTIEVWEPYSDHQKSNALADAQNPKSPKRAGNAGSANLPESASFAGLSFQPRHQSDNKPAALSALIDFERSVLTVSNQEKLLWSANGAGKPNWSSLPMPVGDFARLAALITTIVENKIRDGKVASHPTTTPFIRRLGGKNVVVLSGREIVELAKDAAFDTVKISSCIKSITSEAAQNSQNYAQALKTLCCYVAHAIALSTPEITHLTSSFSLSLTVSSGWTAVDETGKAIPDSRRYHMLGNAVAVPVVEWIGRRIARAV